MKRAVQLFLVLFSVHAFGQNFPEREERVLSLDECISIALKNNLSVKRSQNNQKIAESNFSTSKLNYLPSVNASSNLSTNNSLQFDRGQVFNQTINRINSDVFADVDLFTGFSNVNARKRDRLALDAAYYDFENSKNQTELGVVEAYLNVLNDRQNISIVEERLNLLNEQLKRAEKRVDVGVDNPEEVYNLKSQIANENLNLVTQQNSYRSNKLILIQLLQLDPLAFDYQLEEVSDTDEDFITSLDGYSSFYDAAYSYSPSIKSARLNVEVSEKNYEISKSSILPSVSLRAGLATGYSSNGALNPNFDPGAPEGDPNSIAFNPDASFSDQFFDANPQKYASVNLRIPIFNKFMNRNNIQVAKINMENAQLNSRQAKLDFDNDVQQAYLNLLNAQSNYRAARENLEALDQSFRFTEASYNAGRTDFYTYLQSLNNRSRGQITLNISKNSVILRKKILDILKGEA
jgi:outer membrane protein